MPARTSPAQSPSLPLEELKAAALAAGAATERDDYLQLSVEQLARILGAERCSLLVIHRGRLVHGGAVGLPGFYLSAIDGSEVSAESGTCGPAASLGISVVTHDLRADPKWADFLDVAEQAGLRSCWSVPLILPDGRVLGSFATYGDAPYSPSADELELNQAHASLVALGLDRLQRDERLHSSYESVVVALSSALDVRDEYTGVHSTETAALTVEVGRQLGLPAARVRQLEQTAMLHDIGKLGIPTDILRAPRPLTDEEIAVVRQHPVIGEQILKGIPTLDEVARAVRHEHERWDGDGYPDGIAGDRIPLASRIVFACDAWHAMTSDRPYRPALERKLAMSELRANAGSQFDPAVVDALLDVLARDDPSAAAGPDADPTDELAAMAAEVGCEDLFVFRKVAPGSFSHFGGAGRGEGWAGNVDVDATEEAGFVQALETGRPVRMSFGSRGHVLGPYYARTAVIVATRPDLAVVFGSSTDSLAEADEDTCVALAEQAAEAVGDVSPEKRLADELEVLEAARSVTAVGADSLEGSLAEIADAGATALSCEFGAVLVFGEGAEPRLGFADRGWAPGAHGDVADLLVPFLSSELDLPLLVQDVCAGGPVPESFRERGATSVHVVPIGTPRIGMLLLVHADSTPRGFTTLCRRVARTVAGAAEVVVRRSLAQEQLAEENELLSRRVRTDALTGAASRTAWEDAVRREEVHRGRSGTPTSVAIFDLDGLKSANDSDGHAAGDALLRAAATVLTGCARATDLVARIGGDEFAVLLRYTDEQGAIEWRDRAREALHEHAEAHPELDLSMSAGVASAPPAPSLADAMAAADRKMYAGKPRQAAG